VFDLYKVHQNATLLPVRLTSPDYISGDQRIAAVNASASVDSAGVIHISLVNLDPSKTVTVRTSFAGRSWNKINGTVLTSGKVNDVNSFDNPGKVKLKNFTGFSKEKDNLTVQLPPKSVVVLELKK